MTFFFFLTHSRIKLKTLVNISVITIMYHLLNQKSGIGIHRQHSGWEGDSKFSTFLLSYKAYAVNVSQVQLLSFNKVLIFKTFIFLSVCSVYYLAGRREGVCKSNALCLTVKMLNNFGGH